MRAEVKTDRILRDFQSLRFQDPTYHSSASLHVVGVENPDLVPQGNRKSRTRTLYIMSVVFTIVWEVAHDFTATLKIS